jgi:hypothetical protein
LVWRNFLDDFAGIRLGWIKPSPRRISPRIDQRREFTGNSADTLSKRIPLLVREVLSVARYVLGFLYYIFNREWLCPVEPQRNYVSQAIDPRPHSQRYTDAKRGDNNYHDRYSCKKDTQLLAKRAKDSPLRNDFRAQRYIKPGPGHFRIVLLPCNTELCICLIYIVIRRNNSDFRLVEKKSTCIFQQNCRRLLYFGHTPSVIVQTTMPCHANANPPTSYRQSNTDRSSQWLNVPKCTGDAFKLVYYYGEAMDVQATIDDTPPVTQRTMKSGTIALLLPTLNELEGLKATVPKLDRSLVDDIIVVDGGSTDGTVEYAMEMGLTVATQMRPGLHAAVFDIGSAIEHDYVIEFSPDGNCMVEQLPEIVQGLRAGYDMVVVSRYLQHAVSEDDHPISAFGNWMFSRLMRPLARFQITDALNIYRGYNRKILLDPDFELYLKGPVLEPLVTGICALRGLKVIEVPGDEPLRIGGVTKRSILYNGSLVLLMIVRLWLRKFLGIRI